MRYTCRLTAQFSGRTNVRDCEPKNCVKSVVQEIKERKLILQDKKRETSKQ